MGFDFGSSQTGRKLIFSSYLQRDLTDAIQCPVYSS